METKTCTKCGIEKPATAEFYYPDKRLKSGLRAKCKECCKKQMSGYYEKNPQKYIQNSKAYQKANPEKIKEIKASYYENNKELLGERVRKWRQNNPEKARHYEAKRRARLLEAKGSHTIEQWQDRCEYYGNKCVDCGSSEITKDHRVPLSKGGTDWASNLIPRCQSCNSRKRDWWVG